MRVLLVSNMYAYPGNWDKLDELGRHVELQVVTPARWSTKAELHPVENSLRHEGGRWVHHPLPTLLQGNPFRYVYRPTPLLGVIRSFRPDVVHVEQEPESLSLLQFSTLKLQYGYCLVFVAWENRHRLRKGALFRWLNYNAADGGIFGLSEAKERARRLGFRGPAVVIPQYGFRNLEASRPPGAPSSDGSFTVGFAGRLVVAKGLRVLQEAVHGCPGTRLLIAGDGPLGPDLGTDSQVELLGTLPRDGMSGFWARTDVLVLPSLTTPTWAEQFGRVLIEAMARGVPVIGSDSGGIPDAIGDAGVVVPEGDAGSLARAISRLQADPGLRAELVARGRARVDAVLHYDVLNERTVAFYHKLMERRQGSRRRAP